MTNFILVALVQVSALGADRQDFDRAYQQSLATGRPLVVLVGARWCPACQKMKNTILPQVAGVGGLSNVVFTYVDIDLQRQVASRLSRGTSIPQLIRFDPTPTGWKSHRVVGARSAREVYEFINSRPIKANKVTRVSAADRPRNDARKPAPQEAVGSTPVSSKARTYSSINARAARRPEVGYSLAEKAGGSSHWAVYFEKLRPENRNRYDGTAGHFPGQRQAGLIGRQSGGGGTDIARSLSDLVSGR